MAINTWVEIAVTISVFTALSLRPKNTLMRKRCLIHLKNYSSYLRSRYRSAINSGFKTELLVKNTRRYPASFLTTSVGLSRGAVLYIEHALHCARGVTEDRAGNIEGQQDQTVRLKDRKGRDCGCPDEFRTGSSAANDR